MGDVKGNARPIQAVTLTDDGDSLRSLSEELLRAAEAAGYDDASRFALRISLEEAVVNGFKHGNGGDRGAGVDVAYEVTPERIVMSVEDRGVGFDPGDVPDPTREDRLTVPSGRGLLLMRAYMSSVEHNARGNRVTMAYERSTGSAQAPPEQA